MSRLGTSRLTRFTTGRVTRASVITVSGSGSIRGFHVWNSGPRPVTPSWTRSSQMVAMGAGSSTGSFPANPPMKMLR